jgi:DNA-binding IclR family transcriptional regulator
MMKVDVLELVGVYAGLSAEEVADSLGTGRAAAAMALLRLLRQGLAWRWVEANDAHFHYALTERGVERLSYLTDVSKNGARLP